MTIVPFTVHLVLLAELLQLTVLSLEKLSIKAVMHYRETTTDVLFESIVEPLITIEESRQNEYNHLW